MSKRKVKCKYGRLKRKIGRRICRQSGTTSKKRGRHSRPRRFRRAAKIGGGALALFALGAGGAIYYWSKNSTPIELGPAAQG